MIQINIIMKVTMATHQLVVIMTTHQLVVIMTTHQLVVTMGNTHLSSQLLYLKEWPVWPMSMVVP